MSNEMKWTPGPWHTGKGSFPFQININTDSGTIATVYGETGENEANAHLIAAAPELYAALADMISSYEALGAPLPMAKEVEVALCALAKARGEQP